MFKVEIGTGTLCHLGIDFFLPGYIPLEFSRQYKSTSRWIGAFGNVWRHSFEIYLVRGQGEVVVDISLDSAVRFPELEVGQQAQIDEATLQPKTLLRSRDHYAYQSGNLSFIFPNVEPPGQRIPLLAVVDRYGNQVRFGWNAPGRLVEILDTLGRTVSLEYDDSSRVERVSLGATAGSRLVLAEYRYNATGDLEAVTNRTGIPYRFKYERHLIVEAENRLGGRHYMAYDHQDRCVYVSKDGGISARSLFFDDEKNQVLVVDSQGYQTLYRLNPAGPLTKIDALGNVTQVVSDERGNVLAEMRNDSVLSPLSTYEPETHRLTEISPSGATKLHIYGSLSKLLRTEDTQGNAWEYEYDEHGKVLQEKSPLGAVWRYLRDDRGYNTALTDPVGFSIRRRWDDQRTLRTEDDLGFLNMKRFDEQGFPVEIVTSKGSSYRYVYGAMNLPVRIDYPDGVSEHFTYDAMGHVLEARDSNGHVIRFEYDRHGKRTRYMNALGDTLEYRYDSEERIVGVRNFKGEDYLFEYEGLGRLIRERTFDGTEVTYRYGDEAQPIEASSPSGVWVGVERDRGGRTMKTFTSDGIETVFLYDPQDRLVEMERAGVRWAYEYDKDGRRIREDQAGIQLGFAYDAADNCTRVDVGTGASLIFTYDGRRRVSAIADADGELVSFTYDDHDNLLRKQFRNGMAESRSYDGRDRVTEVRLTSSRGSTLERTSYEFDPGGRLVRETRGGVVRQFHYDRADRVTEVIEDGVSVEHYEYDATHNVLSGLGQSPARIGRGDRLEASGQTRVRYDSDGNLIQMEDGARSLSLDFSADGSVQRIREPNGDEVRYGYDPLGRRMWAQGQNWRKRFVWFDQYPLAEIQANGREHQRQKVFLFEPFSFVPLLVRDGPRWFVIQSDSRGLPRTAWGEDQERAWALNADLWGNDVSVVGEVRDLVPFRLLGQYRDAETGLCYNRFRYYWPGGRRFVSHDPLGVWGGINLYAFGPNPLHWADPYGLQPAQLIQTVDCRTVKPCPNGRNPRDVAAAAVGPCPTALPFNYQPPHPRAPGPRGGGGPRHNECCQHAAQSMTQREFEDVRVNQHQVTGSPSQRVGINRPDSSGFNPQSQRRENYEFDRPPSSRAQGHADRICNNDCDALVHLYEFDPNDTGQCV